MFLKILILVIFFAVMIGVGVYYRKSTKDVQGFVRGIVGRFVAHGVCIRNILLLGCYIRRICGQFGWKYGMSATWIGIGNALIGSLLAWRILGRRTADDTVCIAPPCDFFGQRFDSEALRVPASAIIFVF